MSLYETFKTDPGAEQHGIVVDYGDARITLARAGGSNKRFQKLLREKVRPYKRAIQTEQLPPDKQEEILREVYAEAIVLNWEQKRPDPESGEIRWVKGIEQEETSELLPFTRENILKTFNALPDLFADLQVQAGDFTLFRAALREAAEGN